MVAAAAVRYERRDCGGFAVCVPDVTARAELATAVSIENGTKNCSLCSGAEILLNIF